MMRALLLMLMLAPLASNTAFSDEMAREELRIPMENVPGGLEALLIRPAGARRLPLALISHGSPRDETARAGMSPNRYEFQATEFARRGFAALVVMRRGYGGSGGLYAENGGPCRHRDYLAAARASVADLRAAIDAMAKRPDIATQGMIAVGQSAGGFASVALAADKPSGLAAVINFAGGRGSRADDDVCDEDSLVSAFGVFGESARVPQLWVYSVNDHFFRPELARRMHAAFSASGGRAAFIEAPAFQSDGHYLFSKRGGPIWTAIVDRFLRDQNLGTQAAARADPPPPPQLSERNKDAFTSYLAGPSHKAFAISPSGAFGWRTGRSSIDVAKSDALDACARHATNCTVYAVDDALAPRP